MWKFTNTTSPLRQSLILCILIVFLWFLCQILKGRPTIDGRPGESLEPLDFDALKAKLEEDFGETENF